MGEFALKILTLVLLIIFTILFFSIVCVIIHDLVLIFRYSGDSRRRTILLNPDKNEINY
jgi:hypothetical protein